jgi:hypothetical protein
LTIDYFSLNIIVSNLTGFRNLSGSFYQHSVPDGTIEAKEEKKKNASFHFAGF